MIDYLHRHRLDCQTNITHEEKFKSKEEIGSDLKLSSQHIVHVMTALTICSMIGLKHRCVNYLLTDWMDPQRKQNDFFVHFTVTFTIKFCTKMRNLSKNVVKRSCKDLIKFQLLLLAGNPNNNKKPIEYHWDLKSNSLPCVDDHGVRPLLYDRHLYWPPFWLQRADRKWERESNTSRLDPTTRSSDRHGTIGEPIYYVSALVAHYVKPAINLTCRFNNDLSCSHFAGKCPNVPWVSDSQLHLRKPEGKLWLTYDKVIFTALVFDLFIQSDYYLDWLEYYLSGLLDKIELYKISQHTASRWPTGNWKKLSA